MHRAALLAARAMVPRYSRPAMTAIWSAENRYRIWWEIEVFAAEAMGKIGMIPAEDAATIRAAYDADVLGEIDVAGDRRDRGGDQARRHRLPDLGRREAGPGARASFTRA